MENNNRVLIIVTSHDQLGSTGTKTGFWLEELATPYWIFRDAGFAVDLASPRGGAAPFDPRSNVPGTHPPSVDRFLGDPETRMAIDRTRRLADVRAEDYAAIFLAGGHGTMWDLPGEAHLAALLGTSFDRGHVVAAVCHGPAGLVGARRADGRPIVEARRVAAFTNAEEEAVGLTKVVPFLLETRLRELGATFVGAAPWQPHAVRDGNLVTGQNPQSSEGVARLVVDALRSRSA